MDRRGTQASSATGRRARHGFERKPDLRRTGRQRLQWAFRLHLYHPLFVFNELGDLERCALRSGNVHSAASWREVLEPVVARYRGTVKRCCFRGDAAFANPEIYEFLEAEGMGYAIRLPLPGTEDQVRQTRNPENVGLTSLNLPDHRAVIMLRLPISSDGFGNIGLERMIDGRQALASQRGGPSGDNCLPETAIPTLRSR